MPLDIAHGRPTLIIRRTAFERSGISRAALDEQLGLTADEFRVEGALVCIGPIPADDALQDLIGELEETGLRHFEDFFDLSGNWPDWLQLYAIATPGV